MNATLRFNDLVSQARALLKPGTESAALDGLGISPMHAALSAARLASREEIAQHLYEIALILFRDAEGASERICVLTQARPRRAVERALRQAIGLREALGTPAPERDLAREIHRLRREKGSLRRRSRRWCEAAIAVSDGRHTEALELYAAHLVLAGDSTAALVTYDLIARSTRNASLRARALSNRAKALLDLGCFQEAERSSALATELMPTHPFAQANLAISKLTLGDAAGAWRCYERARQACSESPEHLLKLTRLLRADVRWLERNRPHQRAEAATAKKVLKSLGLVSRVEGTLKHHTPTDSI
ncbi:MAG: hypothetical protein JNJ88_05185 [Planctomycetes bacterium]|nr:hypothetical protein [Planctomycetota bacterium]